MSPPEDLYLIEALRRIHNPTAPLSGLFDIKESMPDNMGLVARTMFPRGTRIFADALLFSIPSITSPLSPKNKTLLRAQAMIHAQDFNTLYYPDETTRTVYPRPRPKSTLSEDKVRRRQFNANSLKLHQGADGLTEFGIFMTAARFSHSCIPNAYHSWDRNAGEDGQGRLLVHAMVDIPKDAEIEINYREANCFGPADQRREAFYDTHHFTCCCSGCNNPANVARRQQMRILENEICRIRRDGHQVNPRYPPADDQRRKQRTDIAELIELLLLEQVWYPQLTQAYGRLADACNEELEHTPRPPKGWLEDICKRGEDAARARLELDVVCTGAESPQVRETLGWMRGLMFSNL